MIDSDQSETDIPRPWTAAERARQLQRLHRALTDEFLRALAKHARCYAGILRQAGVACGPDLGRDLVQDAVLAVIEGRRRWDGVVPLDVYLRGVIRSQVSAQVTHAKLIPMESLDFEHVIDDGDEAEDELQQTDAVDHVEPREDRLRHRYSVKDAARRLLVAIQTAAPLDLPIRRVLEAWSKGHIDRGDAIAASGLTPAVFDATTKRIKWIAESLPEDLIDGVVDALEVSYVG